MPEDVNAQEVAETSAKAMWAGDRASQHLGMEIVEVGPGYATMSMVVRDDMINGWDVCHGGIIASLADSAFAFACNSHGQVTVASGFEITLLESAHVGDTLLATATERSSRGRAGIYDMTVTRESTTIAEFRGRSHSLGRAI